MDEPIFEEPGNPQRKLEQLKWPFYGPRYFVKTISGVVEMLPHDFPSAWLSMAGEVTTEGIKRCFPIQIENSKIQKVPIFFLCVLKGTAESIGKFSSSWTMLPVRCLRSLNFAPRGVAKSCTSSYSPKRSIRPHGIVKTHSSILKFKYVMNAF